MQAKQRRGWRPAGRGRRKGRNAGSRYRSSKASEGADHGKEALQPTLAAGTGDLALADVSDVGVGDARRGDPVVGADVDRADQPRDLDALVAAVEGEQLLTLHQHRAIRINFGDRHADLASELV